MIASSAIRDITVELAELPAQPRFRWRDGLRGSEPAVTGGVLTIRTEDGLEGRAETRRGVIVNDIVQRQLRDFLGGVNAFAREEVWHRIWELDRIEELPSYALGLVDVALWDLAGRALGVPVYQLLGAARTEIPAYASTVTYSTVEEYLDVADQCLQLGFRAIKMHAWGDVRADADLCVKMRAHVGPDIALMYDGSAGFDLDDAIYLGRTLADAGYRWYEEPMREFSISAYRRLASRVDVPLLVGENSEGAHMNMADFIAAGAAGAVRTGANLKGGVTGAMRIAHLADAYLMRAEVHGWGAVSRNLCMAISNNSFYEALVWGNPIQTDPAVVGGVVAAPTTPGIG